MDDPGPGTATHPMVEYVTTINAAGRSIGMSDAELVALASATRALVQRLRLKLHAQGKHVWLNGADYGNPFRSIGASNCSSAKRPKGAA